MLRLRTETPPGWLAAVLGDFDAFLQDHAHNERKVVQTALILASQYPRRTELVAEMIELAEEELSHFRQLHDLLSRRGRTIGQDKPDPYLGPLRKALRKRDYNEYLLDRLLCFGIVEARGCERFRLLSEGHPDEEVRALYAELFRCEARHHELFTRLARLYFPVDVVRERLDELLELEAEIVRGLELRPALH